MVDIPTTAFVTAPDTPAGQPPIQSVDLSALGPVRNNLIAPNPPPAPSLGKVIASINQAIAADQQANTPGTTALPPPDNIAFTDLTAGISASIPGDAFKGGITDITSQFIDLTPDNLLIRAITPNAFIGSGSGNDVLIAQSGHNILDGGSGRNVYVGGPGQDTSILDITKAGGSALLQNAGTGDDIVLFGASLQDFNFSVSDKPTGLTIDATTKDPASTRSAEITFPGFTLADGMAGKLSLGVSQTGGVPYLFVHVT